MYLLKVTLFSSVTIWEREQSAVKSVFSYREFFELPFEMGGEDIRGGKGGGFSRCFQVSPGALRAGGDAQCRLQRKVKNIFNNVKSQKSSRFH